MGGSRAKERRHLERVEKQKEYHRRYGGKFQAPDPATVMKNANNNGSFDVYHEDDKPPLLSPPTPPIASEPKKGGGGNTKQKVAKKPKHLKRKLLSLNPEKQSHHVVQEETTSSKEIKERERILDEIQKWESQKVAHRHNKTLSKTTKKQHEDIKSQTEKSSRPQSLNPKKQSLPSKAAVPMIKSDFSRNVKPKSSVESAAISANEKSNKKGSIEQSREQVPSSKSPSGVRDEAVSSSSSAKEPAEDKVSTRAKTESESAATKDVTMKTKFDDEAAAAVKKSNNRSSNELDDDDDNDDDDNILKDDPEKRQRGKRRRGRKDTSKNIPKEGEHQEQEEKDKMSIEQQEKPKEKDASTVDAPAMEENEPHELNSEEQKKQSEENDGRYCIGRKPVTDFIIGQTYPGKIVYMKPFGVFFDLGCHKDAFCHVSRLQDDYVESPESLFQVGDVVENCRVVEIDRKQQRITVSLQSIARIQDERASVEARKGRHNKRKKSSSSSSSSFAHQGSPQKQKKMSNLIEKDASPAALPVAFVGNVKNITGMNFHVAIKNKPPLPPLPPPPPHVGMEQKGHAGQQEAVGLTPAEQKRARKLARRASRREEKEAE